MSSADEDDVHQCGRCKAVFHSIDEYFTHKKSKFCQKKEKSGQRVRLFDDNEDGNSRDRGTLNTPKYIPSSSLYDSFLELVGIGSNDGFSQDSTSKDGLSHKSPAFMGFSFEDSNNGMDAEKHQKKGAKRKYLSPPSTKITGRKKGRPKKAVKTACTMCDFKALYQKDMDRHMLAEHKVNKFTCQHCDARFKSRGHLNEHLQVCFLKSSKPNTSASVSESGDGKECSHSLDENSNCKMKDFECQDCGKSFSSFEDLSKHVAEDHKEISPGICRFCGRWFPTKYKIFKHLTTSVHPEISEAGMKVARSEISHLKVHWKVPKFRSGNMIFSCKKCHLEFNKKQDLMTHNRHNHATEKNYSCENCGETFRTQRLYLSHLSKHSIRHFEPGFKCPSCGKQFQKKIHVCRHIDNLHTPVQQVPEEMLRTMEPDLQEDDDDDDEDIFECFVCSKQLVSQAKMLKHVQLHRVWCTVLPDGLQPGTDHLYEKLHSQNPTAVVDFNKPSLAILHGMKPLQDGVDIPAGLPTSCENDDRQSIGGASADKNDSTSYTPKESVNNSGSESGRNGQSNPQVLPSMPLDLVAPSPVGSGNKLDFNASQRMLVTSGNTPIGQNLVAENGSPALENARSPVLNSSSPDDDQCSTIDQSALRDLVEALETISNENIGNHNDKESINAQMEVNQNGDHRLSGEFEISDLGKSQDMSHAGECSSATFDASLSSEGRSQESASDSQKLLKSQSLVCPYCLKTFPDLMQSYLHKVNEHNLVAVFTCISQSCKIIFHSVKEYENHSETHPQLAFICRICNDHFSEFQEVIAHKISAHRIVRNSDAKSPANSSSQGNTGTIFPPDPEASEKSFLCDQCGVTLGSKQMLSRHRLSHTRGNDLICKECGANFKNREHLRRHIKTLHSNEKPFQCTFEGCNKAFSRKDKLRDHLKVHTLDKPYVCQYCSKAYRFRDGLKNHERSHQNELKYFCTQCESAFSKPAMLRAHMSAAHQIALQKNSYPCHQCPKVFNRPERLKRHMEKAHQVTSQWKFNCSECSKGFAGLKSYQSHIKTRHANKNETTVDQANNLEIIPVSCPDSDQIINEHNVATSTDQNLLLGMRHVQSSAPIVDIQTDQQAISTGHPSLTLSGSTATTPQIFVEPESVKLVNAMPKLVVPAGELLFICPDVSSASSSVPIQLLNPSSSGYVASSNLTKLLTVQSSAHQPSLTASTVSSNPNPVLSMGTDFTLNNSGVNQGTITAGANTFLENSSSGTSAPLQVVLSSPVIAGNGNISSTVTGLPASASTNVSSTGALWPDSLQAWQTVYPMNAKPIPVQMVTSNSSTISLPITSNNPAMNPLQVPSPYATLENNNVPQGDALSPEIVVPTSRISSLAASIAQINPSSSS